MSDILFEIKTENLETGLRGYPVGYCTTSTVDPLRGLFYVGHPLSEMSNKAPEEVIFLLFHGREGSPQEIDHFKKTLNQRSTCSPEFLKQIRLLPRRGQATKLFSIALLLGGIFEGTQTYAEDALNLVAKIPEIAATVINHHAGWKLSPPSDPSLGYIENFVHMLNVPEANPTDLIQAFSLFSKLHYDHGGGNLSAFVGKATASGLEDLYGSMAAAMCALAGPRHGRANQDSLEFLQKLSAEVGEDPTEKQLAAILEKKLEQNELIFGFGHAVLRVEDPRATLLYTIIQTQYPSHPLVKLALLLRQAGSHVLQKSGKISDPHPNVDAVSGLLLSVSGFPYPQYFTVLFGMARTVGIARQIVYEREEARGGKGTPIVRPNYLFKSLST